MSPRGQWMFDPDAGGKKIPEAVKRDIKKTDPCGCQRAIRGQIQAPGNPLSRPVLLY